MMYDVQRNIKSKVVQKKLYCVISGSPIRDEIYMYERERDREKEKSKMVKSKSNRGKRKPFLKTSTYRQVEQTVKRIAILDI